jgi:hypothetical protein
MKAKTVKKRTVKKHLITPEEAAFLAENVKGRPFEELRRMFNDRFNLNFNILPARYLIRKKHISFSRRRRSSQRSSVTGRK